MGFDYRTITPERVATLTDEAIAAADLLLANAATASPTSFEGTVQPIDDADALVYAASGRGAFMARVHPEAAVRDAGQAAETRIRTWQAALPGREDLARAVRAYAETDAARELNGQQRRLLDHLLRDFRRAGQDLPAEQRAEAGRLRSRIVELEVAFQRNIDEWQDGLDLTREELDGLPEDYVGRLAICRVRNGTIHRGQTVAWCRAGDVVERAPVGELYVTEALDRVEAEQAGPGEIIAVAGIPEITIGETLADPDDPRPLPVITVDEPSLSMTIGINTSPLSGQDGTKLTARLVKSRLDQEVVGNVSIRVFDIPDRPEAWEVQGRGELQLAVLVELVPQFVMLG